jgi:tRNA A-37 threonylcarbamoyl transferase component Bud32
MKTTHFDSLLMSFKKGEETIPLPFDLNIENKSYRCTQILRLLASKRLVVKAYDEAGHSLLIKLFIKQSKGERELARELRGYQLTKQTDINVPELIFTNDSHPDYCVIAYQYLEGSASFGNTNEMVLRYGDELMALAASLHNADLLHSDFHLDNILIADDKLYLIDLASIYADDNTQSEGKENSLANLAVLIVQFKPREQKVLISKLQQYYQQRGWQYNVDEQKEFEKLVRQAWQKRKTNYLKKCFRKCTMTAYKKTFSQQYAFYRPFLDEVGDDFIKNMDQLVTTGKILKAGNSATVVQLNYAGRDLVIKRYNIKSFWHFFKRCYRPSRAAVSWKNGRLLQLLGVATPKPLGFIERRYGWLRSTAYFICEKSDGQEMLSVFNERMPTDEELNQIKILFDTFKQYQISHGDFKASNLLIKESGEIEIIDLDAMQEHSNIQSFQRRFKKDKARFLRNWHSSALQNLLLKVID